MGGHHAPHKYAVEHIIHNGQISGGGSRGARYENLQDDVLHLARCPDCGGMDILDDETMFESDCIRCVFCGHMFDTRLEMMESCLAFQHKILYFTPAIFLRVPGSSVVLIFFKSD